MSDRAQISIAAGLTAAVAVAVAIIGGGWFLGALGVVGTVLVVLIGWVVGVTIYLVDYVSESRAPGEDDDDE